MEEVTATSEADEGLPADVRASLDAVVPANIDVPAASEPPAEDLMRERWVDLPSGFRVHFCDATTLRAGDKKAVMRQINHQTGGGVSIDMIDGVLALVIDQWNVPGKPELDPQTRQTLRRVADEETTTTADLPRDRFTVLDELQMNDYDFLTGQVGPLVFRLFPELGPSLDPDSPTAPSAD